MPSARDQLSKLSGTVMTCICIGFMALSVVSSKESESVSNMASLSIFVVTVAVNICIQLVTGVIFSFVAEHIIIICCMFMLLAILWSDTIGFNTRKAILHEENVARFRTMPLVEACFIHQAKKWYISRSVKNPQLLLCCEIFSSAIGPICIMCFVVLLQATYRSIVVQNLEFCGGVSDYKWSMWILVITQLAGATIGALAISFRWLATIGHLDGCLTFSIALEVEALNLQFSFMKRRSLRTSIMVLSRFAFKSVLIVFVILINVPIFAFAFVLSRMLEGTVGKLRCCAHKAREDTASLTLDSWRNVFEMEDRLSQRLIGVCVDNMSKWMNVKRDPPPYQHMVQLLSKYHLSTAPPLLNRFFEAGFGIKKYIVTSLSMVVLAKVVPPLFPSSSVLAKSMTDALCEAFEIIYYIDKKMNVKVEDSEERQLAKLLWEGGEIDMISKKVLLENDDNHDAVEFAISNVKRASEKLPAGHASSELVRLFKFIRKREYETVNDLCGCVEQLFCEMLQHFLSQLPISVFKEVNESSFENWEERGRFITKRLCELDSSLEDKVRWRFPDGWPDSARFFDPPGPCNYVRITC
ncbi:hypothetical protein Sjap_009465 [Stephania japonica]|uniref:Uncharacterized protein n=1 Tax=Stephania japonica TaxID=461633 RepID=A0AAP0JS20_9MAGN